MFDKALEYAVEGLVIGVGIVVGERVCNKAAPHVARTAVAARDKAIELRLRANAYIAERRAAKLETAATA